MGKLYRKHSEFLELPAECDVITMKKTFKDISILVSVSTVSKRRSRVKLRLAFRFFFVFLFLLFLLFWNWTKYVDVLISALDLEKHRKFSFDFPIWSEFFQFPLSLFPVYSKRAKANSSEKKDCSAFALIRLRKLSHLISVRLDLECWSN